ncbi:MAG TPA: RNA polymerase sigma factor [Thermoanaerobaculia bacterium]|nr:RNA polymerase sigma factor [Thermoanaerobaculia bacterium]
MNRDARFETMYRKYFARVYRFFYFEHHITDDEAQDLAQETFVRVYESFDSYRGEAEWGFLKVTATRVLLNWIRKAHAAKRSGEVVEIDDPEIFFDLPAPEGPDAADRQLADLRRAALAEAFAELSPAQQECLRLSILGFKYNEIASILKISLDAVRSRLRDAKRYLRTRLGGKS